MNRKLKIEELERKTVSDFKNAEKYPIVIVLENIRSLNNIGSAFRTADAFGIKSIYLVGYTARPPHRDINKTAIGATKSVHWEYFESSESVLNNLQLEGYQIYSIEQTDNAVKLQDVKWNQKEKIALVFGNELTGVEQNSIDHSVKCIEIPQFGTKHSLNVSVSVGVVLWSILKDAYLS